MTLQEKIDQYLKHFGEPFPLMMLQSSTESEIISKIDSCIARNETYKYDGRVLY